MRSRDFITKLQTARVSCHGCSPEQLDHDKAFLPIECIGSTSANLFKDGAKLYLAWVVSTVGGSGEGSWHHTNSGNDAKELIITAR